MNRHQNRSHRIVRNPSYRQALQRLDELLEQNGGVSNAEKTELLGRRLFGDLWDAPAESGSAKINE